MTVPHPAKTRLDFIDNLRWVMIVLVVSMHAAVTYSHLGSWYFMEDPKPGQLVMVLFAYYQMSLQAFFMGFLFLIAGYFVLTSLFLVAPPRLRAPFDLLCCIGVGIAVDAGLRRRHRSDQVMA